MWIIKINALFYFFYSLATELLNIRRVCNEISLYYETAIK